jgi:DNA-binding CsgD family transcriptional regulator
MTQILNRGAQDDEVEIGHPSAERARAASEIGAAIVHQLSGPLTALLLYVGDLHRNSDRFPTEDDEDPSLRQIAENALRETQRVCSLLQKIGDASIAPLKDESNIAHGREVINWWSRAAGAKSSGQTGDSNLAAAVSASAGYALLTPRERQVLLLVSEGLSSKQGAIRLRIGPRTFESHRARIMRKFKARNAAELVRMALGEAR